ncbi:MAG: hypothetical protein HYV15_00040, partial [Elusimicrobia bacterium]|nr:hypothetical protein [Elusimicrobiota bacterium]
MPAPADAPDAAAERTTWAFCAAVAVALTMVRLPAVEGSNLHLLTQHALHPASLGSSVLVTASHGAPYTVGPLFVSRVLA